MLDSDLGVKVIRELPDTDETGSEGAADEETELRAGSADSVTSHEFGLEEAPRDFGERRERRDGSGCEREAVVSTGMRKKIWES